MVDSAEARRQAFLDRMNTGKQTSSGIGLGFFKGNLQSVNFWQCKEGDHDMDIIPYLAGPNDPDTPEGQWTYVLEVYEHRDVGGIEGQSYICMAKTYKQPCPICEHRQTLIKEGADDEVIKELRPSRYPRSIYNVLIYDGGAEEDKGIQVFHTSHYIMEMYLLKLAESSKRDIEAGHPPYKFFADPEEGYSVRFTRTGKGVNTRFIGHQLVQRNYIIPQETLDLAHPIDELIHIPEYDEVYKAFWGEDLSEHAAQDVLGDPPAAASPRGATPAAAPGGRGAVQAAAPAAEAPVYEEQAGDYVCPGGGTFGVDTYSLQHCENCELWEPCVQTNQEAGGASEAEAAAPAAAPPAQPAQPAGRAPAAAPPARGGGRGAPATAPPARGGPVGTGRAAPPARGGPAGPGRAAAPGGRGGAAAGNARPAPGKRSLR